MRRKAEAEQSYRLLYERHWHRVCAYSRRRCDDLATADEVVADVFLVAWRKMDDIPADREDVWLLGVAKRILANRRRSQERNHRLITKLMNEAHSSSGTVSGPGEVSLGDEAVREALKRLRPVDAELLRLVAWERLPHAEIAAVFGCSVNAVTVRLHRARQRLVDQLERVAGTDQEAQDTVTPQSDLPVLEPRHRR